MIPFPDIISERPDEFDVYAVDNGIWTKICTFESRSDAEEYAVTLKRDKKYSRVAVKPQIGVYRPFQTHVMYEL